MASKSVGSSSSVTDAGTTPPSVADPTRGSSALAPTPNLVFVILQQLEDAIRRTAIIVSEGVGRYYDMLPFIEESLEEIRRVGGPQLAWRCERELHRLEGMMYRLEGLVHTDSGDELPPLVMSAMFEREALARRILAQEAELKRLQKRHLALLAKMDAYHDACSFTEVESLQGEENLKKWQAENAKVCRLATRAWQVLRGLRQEAEDGEAALVRLWWRQEEQARAKQAAELADVKAKIATFSLSKLL